MVQKIIKTALAAGVQLYLEEQKLKFTAPKGALTIELKEAIANHKEQIIAYLQFSAQQPGINAVQARPDPQWRPLSLAQSRLWFLHQLSSGTSSEYTIFAAFEVEGSLNIQIVKRALLEIIMRHEVLRCGYLVNNGEALQFLHETFELPFTVADWSHLDPLAYQQKVEQLSNTLASYVFDLSKDLMLQVTLVSNSDKQHCLLFTMHHIASDGWSIEILAAEFVALYHRLLQNQQPDLTELTIQYADYAYWQTQQVDNDLLSRQLAFWQDYLDGIPAVHNLPLDRPRPAQQNFHSNQLQVPLGQAMSEQLRELAKSHSVTLFTLLQSAFAYVLGRFSNEKDIIMATPVAGREREEVQSLIGCFLNTVVLRTQLPEAGDFWQFLAQNKTNVQQAFGHQDVPFDQLVEVLQPARSLAYNPIAQVKFVLQNYKQTEFELPDLQIKPLTAMVTFVRYDLDLTVTERYRELELDWNYKSELFDASTIKRLSSSLVYLLSGLIQQKWTASLPALVSEEVQAKLIATGTGTVADHTLAQPICLQFLQQAAATPENTAVCAGAISLTYAELQQKVVHLAGYLFDQGLGRGDHVAILLPKTADLLVALLAVQLSGATYIPLDKESGSIRLDGILTDTDAALLITTSAMLELVSAAGCDVMLMDDYLAPDWLHEFVLESLPAPVLSDVAYLIYTSGSTGKPKGVEITQYGLMDYCAFAKSSYYHNDLLGSLVATEPAFDISVPSLYLPLLSGDCVTLLPNEDVIFALVTKLKQLSEQGVLLRLTPSHCQALLHVLDGQSISANCVLVIGGEALSQKLASELRQMFPKSALYNHYGPSETVVGCCLQPFNDMSLSEMGQVPIGRPMANTQLLVLDNLQQLQVPGGIGELWIGGAGVANGYWQRPELTRQCFVQDVLKCGSEMRYYKSGDLVRWNSQDQLEFIGRKDHQVKIRGHRVELSEIDVQLSSCEGIEQAITMLCLEAENQYLVCYYVANASANEHGQRSLERLAKQQLPPYMRPQYYVELDAFPLSRNGKINRHALPSYQNTQITDLQVAESLTEIKLIEICAVLLNGKNVSATSDFFALGGHSLLAVRLMNEVAKHLGKKLQLKDIFNHSCIHHLALFIDGIEAEEFEPIPSLAAHEIKQLSVAQRRLWLLTQIDSHQAQYNMPYAAGVVGDFDPLVAEHALADLLERHQILQTNLVVVDGEPKLQPSNARFCLEVVDVTQQSPEHQQRTITSFQQQEIEKPFDLGKDCLLRGTFIRQSDAKGVLLLTTHHIATDGWSINILLRDFLLLYKSKLSGIQAELPYIDIHYSDYAAWQNRQLAQPEQEAQLQYWLSHLAGLDVVHPLPICQARSNQRTFAGNNLQWQFSDIQLQNLKRFAVAHNVTLFMLLHALLSLLICRHTQHQQVVIGTPVANRHHPQLDNLVGFFINNLVLKLDCDLSLSFNQFLSQVKQTNLDALSRQTVPFEQLVEKLSPGRSLYYSPLFQIMLILDNTHGEGESDFKLPFSLQPQPQQSSVAKYELTWHVRENAHGLMLNVEYRTELFEQQYVEALMAQFAQLLDAVLESPTSPTHSYSLITPQHHQYLLHQLNNTSCELNPNELVQNAIEIQALSQPDKVAAIFNHESLTFKQLNGQANKVARYLQNAGVQPGDLVGICQERSLSLLVNMLAILKAGAAYVPLDPAYPAERLDYIVADSGLKHLITEVRLQPIFTQSSTLHWHLVDDFNAGECDIEPLYLSEMTAQRLAYVIYTSGSTGRPKGVKVSHRNVVNFFAAMDGVLPESGPKTTWLASTSISFDISVLEFFWSLARGARVVIQPERPKLLLNAQLADVKFAEVVEPRTGFNVQNLSLVLEYDVSGEVFGAKSLKERAWLACEAEPDDYAQVGRESLPLCVLYQGADFAALAKKISVFKSQCPNSQPVSICIAMDEAYEGVLALSQLQDLEACVGELAALANYQIDEVLVVSSKTPKQGQQHQYTETIRAIRNRRAQLICQAALMAERFKSDWEPASLITEYQVSHLQCTPSFVRELLQNPSGRQALERLELLLVGGEALSEDLAIGLHELLPNRVFNMYGPTECTVWSCVAAVNADAVTIGRPVANTQVYVVDEHLQLAPLGAMGELCIAGEGVAQGYLNRPELTAQRFIQLAFLTPDKIAYKTGDLVRWNENGALVYLGRNDDQVKIKGHRIELGEVERLLSRLPDCQQVAVVRQHHANTEQLVAFVVLKQDVQAGLDWSLQCRIKLSTLAPSYLVPDLIEIVAEFPLTPNGKVDKVALARQKVTSQTAFSKAESNTEMRLQVLWQSLLDLNRDISVYESFFTLGGHSLQVVRLVNQLNVEFSCALSVRDVFENNTIAALSSVIESKTASVYQSIPVRQKESEFYPLSVQQRRLWFIDQLYGGMSSHYDMQILLEAGPQFDLNIAQQVLTALIQRHQTLRTRYQNQHGVAVQVIVTQPEFEIARQVLASDVELSRARLYEVIAEQVRKPFNLSEEIPILATFVTAKEASYLMLCVHHIATDAWSMDILAQEFCTLYLAILNGNSQVLPPLTVDYVDYALWQQSGEQLQHIALQNQYWLHQLSGMSELNSLPLDYPRAKLSAHRSQTVVLDVDSEQLNRLRQIAQNENATVFMYLHAILSLVICRYSAVNEIAIGTPVANRPRKELNGLVGLFINTLVLRSHYNRDDCFIDYLRHIKDVDVAALANQETPFEWLVEQISSSRTTSYNPLVQILFDYQYVPDAADSMLEQYIKPVKLAKQQSKFELSVKALEYSDTLVLHFDYDESLFAPQTIERFVRSFEQILQQTLVEPAKRLANFTLATRDGDLSVQQGPVNLRGRDASLFSQFQHQVAQVPQAVAIVYNEQRLSYEDLSEKSAQLADYLRKHNLGCGSRIGLYLNRGPEILIAMIAINHIGACFVPIDLFNQHARLQSIVVDAALEYAIVSPNQTANWPVTDCAFLPLSVDAWSLDDYSRVVTPAVYQPLAPAYIIYTSGSTGKPKGVEIPNQAIVDYCQFSSEHYYHGQLAGSVLVTSYGFDISLPALLLPLLKGGFVDLSDDDSVLSYVAQLLSQPSCRRLLLRMTPMHVRALLTLMSIQQALTEHVFVIGGELLPVSLLAELMTVFPSAIVYNHYGPTETTVGCCMARVSDRALDQMAFLPIGRAMENTQLYVLDEAMQIVPTGVVGELYVAGRGIANGYMNRPELTQEKFIENPFRPGEKLYHTGDLVRQSAAGELYYVGRTDEQVKLHGFRIELGEVTQQLLALPDIQAAASVVTGEGEHRRLVAYVVLDNKVKDDKTLTQVLAKLRGMLPHYLCPSQLIELPELPLSANGKVNKKALPRAKWEDLQLFSPAETATERQISALWQKILRLEQLPSVESNFFDIGGNSLLVMTLSAQLQQQFSCVIQISQLFNYQTIRQQADFIEQLSVLLTPAIDSEEFEDEGVL